MMKTCLGTLALAFLCVAQAFGQQPISTSAAPKMLTSLHARQWIALDAKGGLTGTVHTYAEPGKLGPRVNAEVVLSKHNQIMAHAVTGDGGKFTFASVKPGTYTMMVRGDMTIATYAVHVLPATEKALQGELDICAVDMPMQVAQNILMTDVVKMSSQGYYPDHMADPMSGSRSMNTSPQVVLKNGAIMGRVSRPGQAIAGQDLSGNVVTLVQGSSVVMKTATNPDGSFMLPGVKPGVYGLFINGKGGVAVLGFEAVESVQAAANLKSAAGKFVAAPVQDDGGVEVEMAPSSEILPSEEEEEEEGEESVEDPGMPLPGGFASPSGFVSGGGGAGGGGIGGAGGALGALGAAVGAAALSNDDEGFNFNRATIIAP